MIERVRNTIVKQNMLESGDIVVLGFSGGPDSLAMLHVLHRLRQEFGLDLVAVHVNHMLRGEDADADEQFVRRYCDGIEVPLEVFHVDVSAIAESLGMSFEEAGRKVRYEKFDAVLKAYNAQKIAVGQNANDVVETALINLFRGAGVDGLASTAYNRNAQIIRPLLDVTRTEIEAYLDQNQLTPCVDKTNFEVDYTRNKIRNELLPYLKAHFNPSIESALMRTVSLMREEKLFWHHHLEKLKKEICQIEDNRVRLSDPLFMKLSCAEQKRLLRYAIETVKGNLIDVSSDQIDSILKIRRTGAYVKLSHDVKITKGYDEWIVENPKQRRTLLPPFIRTEYLKREDFERLGKNDLKIAVDADSIIGELSVRTRKPGDRFKPFGMEGFKKLKDFFIDEKIPREQRDEIWLVCDDEKIIWVYDYRIDNRCRITKDTENILMIALETVVEND